MWNPVPTDCGGKSTQLIVRKWYKMKKGQKERTHTSRKESDLHESLLFYLSLELDNLRWSGKGTERSGGVGEVEYLSIGIIFVVHMAQIGVFIQH